MSSRPTQQFVKGQTILQEGTQGDRTYRILAGEVVIYKKNSHGNLVPIAKLGAGEIFGEMYLFDGAKTRSASAVAISADVTLEIYFQDEIQQMLDRLSPNTLSIFEGLSLRLRKTSGKFVDMAPGQSFSQLPDGTLKQSGSFIRRNN